MFGSILRTAFKILPAAMSIARHAPGVAGIVGDVVMSARGAVKPKPEAEDSAGFAENALTVLAFAAGQFKTQEEARRIGVAHGTKVSARMNRISPGWELAEDKGLIPYLRGLIQGLNVDG